MSLSVKLNLTACKLNDKISIIYLAFFIWPYMWFKDHPRLHICKSLMFSYFIFQVCTRVFLCIPVLKHGLDLKGFCFDTLPCSWDQKKKLGSCITPAQLILVHDRNLKSYSKKKRDMFKHWTLVKNSQFLLYFHETLWK